MNIEDVKEETKSSGEDDHFGRSTENVRPVPSRKISLSEKWASLAKKADAEGHPESRALFFENPDSSVDLRKEAEKTGSKPSRKTSVSEDRVNETETRIDKAYRPKVLKNLCPDASKCQTSGNEVKILVIYTGGTIGMTCKRGVYSPEPDFLIRKLRTIPHLYDAEYVKKFLSIDEVDESGLHLALPESRSGKRIIYIIYEYEPLLDSSNITMVDWIRIARDIELSYAHYDGFVVLHGTDTMSYTASALSFMLENLRKPVVVTGSQIPITEMRSDGRDNFLGALYMAGHYSIPEVCLYFNCKLMRGNRTSKVSTNRLDAFDSPNFPPLATLEVDIQVNWDAILGAVPDKFRVHATLNRHVGILRLFPSISTELVVNYLNPPMAGVILQTYGMGNAPDNREDLIDAFREATNRGVIIINISQCPRGTVAATYAVSAALIEAGVIGGGDMTPEAGLAKLSYVLSKSNWSIEKKRLKMSRCLRGEMHVPKASTVSNLASPTILGKLCGALGLESEEEIKFVKSAFVPSLLAKAIKTGDKEMLLNLYQELGTFNVPTVDERSLLHIAAVDGRVDMAALLLERGALLHVRDAFGRSPLVDAVERKNIGMVKLLVKAGAHLSGAGNVTGKFGAQICLAVWKRDPQLVRCWLEAGANPNDPDYAGRRPLHVAAHALVRLEIVQMLLEYGAKTYLSDSDGKTPLDFLNAIETGNRTERWNELFHAISSWDNEAPLRHVTEGDEGDDDANKAGASLSADDDLDERAVCPANNY